MATLSSRIVQANLVLADSKILVGDSSGEAQERTVSGDITINNTGVAAIASGAIVNADVNASAAIAGSKIDPDFGSQDVVTTGDVGIGTASPGGKVHVYSASSSQTASTSANDVIIESNDSAGVSLLCGPDGTGRIAFGDVGDPVAGRIDYNFTANSITMGTNGASSHFTIDSVGSVTLGPSSGLTASHVIRNSNTAGTVLTVQSLSGSDISRPAMIIQKTANDSSSNNKFIWFLTNNGGLLNGAIVGNGSDAAAFAAISDRRLKTNIAPLEDMLTKINSLKPCSFDYVAGGHNIGFVAQEMQEVFPDSVSTEPDEMGTMMVVGWDKTSARLVAAIQEQQTLIEQLTSRIADLEAAE